MGEVTEIAWTHSTFNPWIGCTKVSEGCKHCYAEAQDRRWGHNRWGPTAARERTSESYWKQPLRWDREAKAAGVRRRVFCASLADVFDDHESIKGEWRFELLDLILSTPNLDWLLLTKRPENILRFWPSLWERHPRPNVWLGTTVENQGQAVKRTQELFRVPAAVRFLSMEPLLGPVDLGLHPMKTVGPHTFKTSHIDWVIVGGESGPGARPFAIEWARSIRDQCAAAGVACFVKQLGAVPVIDETAWRAAPCLLSATNKDRAPAGTVPVKFQDRKGGDWGEWPADLRVREFPEARDVR
jgi:protein gp37